MLVCDEAVAALDVSIQAQILNLFMDLREDLGLTYLFISHDLGVVEHLSDRVVIMYLGRVVETATVQEVFQRPNHPYTQALLAEIPDLKSRRRSSPPSGRDPQPAQPARRLPFPSALPACDAALQDRGSHIEGNRHPPPFRLSLERHALIASGWHGASPCRSPSPRTPNMKRLILSTLAAALLGASAAASADKLSIGFADPLSSLDPQLNNHAGDRSVALHFWDLLIENKWNKLQPAWPSAGSRWTTRPGNSSCAKA